MSEPVTKLLTLNDGQAVLRHRRLELKVLEGPDAGKRLSTSVERIGVGTAEGNGLVLQDPTVSRFHLELSREGPHYRVRDLDSTNGTFIEGVQLVEGVLGERGALRLGDTKLAWELERSSDDVSLHPDSSFGLLKGESGVMRALFAQLAKLSQSNATVLITGESGTGKELVAQSLHQAGKRAKGPFVVVDCGAIPPDLVESELFGHEKGAFTGALRERKGAFEAADGGTLFLDEIGELPLAIQPRLLRALESRQVKRVGSDEHHAIDVRIIAATHRDLGAAVNRGELREDLYYRLAVGTVRVPSLRERLEDLPVMLEHLWRQLSAELGQQRDYPAPGVEVMRALKARAWKGNVRELRNFVERSLAMSDELALDLPASEPAAASTAPEPRLDIPFHDAKTEWVDHFERRYLSARLKAAGGNVSRTAREVGLDRAHLIRLLRKHSVG